MRFIPEESVCIALSGDGEAHVVEVISESLTVETGGGKSLAGQRADLTVVDIVLQEKAYLLSAEEFTDSPRVDKYAQALTVRLIDDFGNNASSEIKIKFSYCENDRGTAVIDHLFEVGSGLFCALETVVTDTCLGDCRFFILSL